MIRVSRMIKVVRVGRRNLSGGDMKENKVLWLGWLVGQLALFFLYNPSH